MSKQATTWPFIKDKNDWVNQNNWTKGVHTNVNIVLKTLHDTQEDTFYFNVFGISGKNDILLNDLFLIDKPNLKTTENEIDFYLYLRCLVSIIVSDIRLLCDNLFIIGPSGIVNCKSNEDQNLAEIYQIENKEEFYNTKYTRFLKIINEKIFLDEIIEKNSETGDSFLDIPFLNTEDLFNLSPFGCTQMISLVRREKHGDLKFDKKYMKYESDYIYIPNKKIIDDYHINDRRQTFIYKKLLDSYINKNENFPKDNEIKVSFSSHYASYKKEDMFLVLEKNTKG